MAPITSVIKRSGAVVPFNKDRISNAIYRAAVSVGGRDRSVAEELATQVVAALEAQTPPGATPTVEEIQDIVETVLIKNGHARTAKAYILYRDERARRRQRRQEHDALAAQNIPWRKIYEVLNWSLDHGVHTVEQLNARMARGEFAEIVAESDRAYNDDIHLAADMIHERRGEIRIAVVAGPSSSGKTTTTIKLSQLLVEMGMHLVPLTVDHYFYDLEEHPIDEFGDHDYETPQALDLSLINTHLHALIAGERVMIPYYDFKTGRRSLNVTPMQIGPDDIILIDSLHGLYGPMMEGIDTDKRFALYIEPLLQIKGLDGRYIRWTDLRLMRRMQRDASHRAYDPQRTLEHWHYVRSSEMRNIIPFVNTTDTIVNSALPYELPVMRQRLYSQFQAWAEQYRDDPLRHDALERAQRIRDMLASVAPLADEGLIPGDSLLREFIGGSVYQY
ncbi:MAG: ATP cone domain-containing protein [Anaerolineae bacterium]|jgi:uridine kinase|nr:response regulator SirA [Chloroflexota bacterium]